MRWCAPLAGLAVVAAFCFLCARRRSLFHRLSCGCAGWLRFWFLLYICMCRSIILLSTCYTPRTNQPSNKAERTTTTINSLQPSSVQSIRVYIILNWLCWWNFFMICYPYFSSTILSLPLFIHSNTHRARAPIRLLSIFSHHRSWFLSTHFSLIWFTFTTYFVWRTVSVSFSPLKRKTFRL